MIRPMQDLHGDRRHIDLGPVRRGGPGVGLVGHEVLAVQLVLGIVHHVILHQPPIIGVDPDLARRLRVASQGVVGQFEVVVQVGVLRIVLDVHGAPGDGDLLALGDHAFVFRPAALVLQMMHFELDELAVLVAADEQLGIDIPGDHRVAVLGAGQGDVDIIDGFVVDVRAGQRLEVKIARRVVKLRALADRHGLVVGDGGVGLRIAGGHDAAGFAFGQGRDALIALAGQRGDAQAAHQVVDVGILAQVHLQVAGHGVAGLEPAAGIAYGSAHGPGRGRQHSVGDGGDVQAARGPDDRAVADRCLRRAHHRVRREVIVGADGQADIFVVRGGRRSGRILGTDAHAAHPAAGPGDAGGHQLGVIADGDAGEQVGVRLNRAGGEAGQRYAGAAVHLHRVARRLVEGQDIDGAVVGLHLDVVAQGDAHSVLLHILRFADGAGGIGAVDLDDSDVDAGHLGDDVQGWRVLRLNEDRPAVALKLLGVHGYGGIAVHRTVGLQAADAEQSLEAVALQRLRVRLAGSVGLDGQVAGGANGRPAGDRHMVDHAARRHGFVDRHAAQQRDLAGASAIARTADGRLCTVAGVVAGNVHGVRGDGAAPVHIHLHTIQGIGLGLVHGDVEDIYGELDRLAHRLSGAIAIGLDRQVARSGHGTVAADVDGGLRFGVGLRHVGRERDQGYAGIGAAGGTRLGMGTVDVIRLHADVPRRDAAGGDTRADVGVGAGLGDHHGHVEQGHGGTGGHIRQRVHPALCQDVQVLCKLYVGIAQRRGNRLPVGSRRHVGADAAEGQLDF